MKQYLFYAAFLLAASATYAQQDMNTAADAVRYSMDNITGTARFRAMSGAFGAVGGDPSALNVNPAGSALFNYNSGTATLTSYNTSNSANYYGTKIRQNANTFDLNQLGGVFVFNNSKEGAVMNKFTLGLNYENTNNFDNNITTVGVNPNTSMAKYFLRYANGIGTEGGIPLGTLETAYYGDLNYIDQQAYLGYQGYIINPDNPDNTSNTSYHSNVPATGNYYDENYDSTNGYSGKIALNFGAQLKQKLYVGMNLNVHFTDYRRTTSWYQDMNNPTGAGLQYAQFDNQRYTYGGGFSFNLGAIYKITEQLRAGLAYESPTWQNLKDEITQRLISNVNGNTIINDKGITFVFDDYTIQSPSKYTGSLAYVFGKSGLISVDYSLRDYSNTQYKSGRYAALNDELSSTMATAGDLRIGGEYRIKQVSFRAGYHFQDSPYKNNTTIGNLNSFSGGLGFNFGGQRLDLAYAWSQRKADVALLTPGLTDAARVTSTYNNVTLSYTIDL
jgi:hypothetical protein